MDDRHLFFAMSDPDWFDVPWRTGAGPDDLVPDVPGWRRLDDGPWAVLRRPGSPPLPDAGWKVHVAATPATAAHVVAAVARVGVEQDVTWKVLRSVEIVRRTQVKYAPVSMSGKVCTLYPVSERALERLLAVLPERLRGVAAPRVVGDVTVPGTPVSLRWGAFRAAWTTVGGRTVPGVRWGGTVRPDRRLDPGGRSAPVVPACVAAVQRAAAAADATQVLPLSAVRLVHRSSAGGVFRGRWRGRDVVLKEARRHTGLDGNGHDAVTRLRHELAVLRRLSGSGLAPEPLDHLELDDAEYLVMSDLGGRNLSAVIASTHPGARPRGTPTDGFDRWAARLDAELPALVAALHARGVVHGDLHPGNVLDTDDGLRLVDFECASVDGAGGGGDLAVAGFRFTGETPHRRDVLAGRRVRLMARTPLVTLLERRPDLEAELLADPGAEVPPPPGAWVPEIVEGLVGVATPGRDDRLFPGGVEQHSTPWASRGLLHGAAGVLLALDAVGVRRPEWTDWLARAGTGPRGLAGGVDGTALALARLGRPERALELLTTAEDPADPGDLSWGTGTAGRAVVLAELAATVPELAGAAVTALRELAAAVRRETPGRGPGIVPGLLRGWAGTAIALRRSAELVPDEDVRAAALAAAETAVEREVALCTWVDGVPLAVEGNRALPHLGHGSAALALAAPGRADVVEGVRRAVGPPVALHAGLLDGRLGALLVLERTHPDDPAVALHRHRLDWHTVAGPGGRFVLGALNLRFSADLASGAAGLLLAHDLDALARLLCLPLRPAPVAGGAARVALTA